MDQPAAGDGVPVEIGVFAPTLTQMWLMGDFNGWEPQEMVKGEDGVFRAAPVLRDGAWRYKLRLVSRSSFFDGQTVDVVDPCALFVEDASPQNGILLIEGGQRVVPRHAYEHDGAPLPPDEALVIYELHLGDFTGGEGDGEPRGTYADAIARIPYLVDLGINAVELLPVKEFPGDTGWGYNPRYLFAAETSYGPPEDLMRLIDACHGAGIRVIMDGVYNQADVEMPLAHMDHDYWFRREPRDPEHAFGPQYDYERFDEVQDVHPARRFIRDVIRYWISTYHFDGIRFDATAQIDHFEALRELVAEARDAAGGRALYCIGEHIPEDPAITGPDGPMDGAWHEHLCQLLRAALTVERCDLGALADGLAGRPHGYGRLRSAVNYLASHDQDRLTRVLQGAGADGAAVVRGHVLGASLLFTSVGVPMIWMGQELGESAPKTQRATKIDWTLLREPAHQALHAAYRGLIRLRTAHPALRSEAFEVLQREDGAGVLAYARGEGAERLLVVANLAPEPRPGWVIPGPPAGSRWRAWLQEADLTAGEGGLTLDLGPREAVILVPMAAQG